MMLERRVSTSFGVIALLLFRLYVVVEASDCRRSSTPSVLFPTLDDYNVGRSCDTCNRSELETSSFPTITRIDDVIDGQTCRILNAKNRKIWLGFDIDDARIARVKEVSYNPDPDAYPDLDPWGPWYGRLVLRIEFLAPGRANLKLYADEEINSKRTRIGESTVKLRAEDKYNSPPNGTKTRGGGSIGPLQALPPRPACFPSDATVQLMNGMKKRMDELMEGDRVLAQNGQYSPIIMFTHKDRRVVHRFVELQTNNTMLRLSYGHYIVLNGGLEKAGLAQVGDLVEMASGYQAPITAIRHVTSKGLFNPQTWHGTMVVNGVVASCYTEAVPAPAAHALLSILRASYNMIVGVTQQ